MNNVSTLEEATNVGKKEVILLGIDFQRFFRLHTPMLNGGYKEGKGWRARNTEKISLPKRLSASGLMPQLVYIILLTSGSKNLVRGPHRSARDSVG